MLDILQNYDRGPGAVRVGGGHLDLNLIALTGCAPFTTFAVEGEVSEL